MGVTQRREREKAELREQILGAARAIVLKEGFEALSMRKIAQAIEYSPATIYLHFKDREEIARQLTREAFGELLAYFAPLQAIKDPIERVRAFGKAYVKFGLSEPESYRLIFMTNQNLSSEIFPDKKPGEYDLDEPGVRSKALLIETVREAIEAKRIAKMDPQVAAHLLWASMHGIVSLQLNCPNMIEFDIDKLTDTYLDILETGMGTKP